MEATARWSKRRVKSITAASPTVRTLARISATARSMESSVAASKASSASRADRNSGSRVDKRRSSLADRVMANSLALLHGAGEGVQDRLQQACFIFMAAWITNRRELMGMMSSTSTRLLP